jgi:hypothetical protein
MHRIAMNGIFFLVFWVVSSPSLAVARDTEWDGRMVERDGVRYVVNSRVGMQPDLRVETTESWQRGGADDEVLFGVIGQIVRDEGGHSYLLDTQLNKVHHIDADGRYLGAIGRAGEGPAEFLYPSGLTLLSDSILCVTQMVPARAVLITLEGHAAGDHALPRDEGTPYLKGCEAVNGRLAIYTAQLVERETSVGLRSAFVVVDEQGRITNSYWEQFQKAEFANMEFDEKQDAEPVWAFGPDGRFYVDNDWDSYEVQTISPVGSVDFVIQREYTHRPRSRAEIQTLEGLKLSGKMASQTKIAETSRDVARICPRDDGSVWILTSRGEMDVATGGIATFDVFDQSGRFVRKCTIQGPFRPGLDSFHLVRDYVYIIVGGAGSGGGGESSEVVGAQAEENSILCLRMKTCAPDSPAK